MSRSRAREEGAARVAVLGAGSPSGALIREALAGHRVSGSRVDLFGATCGDVVLSEYDGEARLIQEAEASEVASHEVIFLCEPGGTSARVLDLVNAGSLVLDLVACSGGAGVIPPLVHPDINPEAALAHQGILRVPHPLSMVLAEVLHPVEKALGIHRVTAVVLRPASDFGERGLEELRDQTVGLLRFSGPPQEVFGRQLAFNLIPQASLGPTGEPGLERRLADEVGRLLGWQETRLAVTLVTVPVFHGHAISVHLDLRSETTVANLREAFAGGRGPKGTSLGGLSTPIEAAGERRTTVSGVSEDGLGGFWLWAVAGEAGAAAAWQAVRLAGMAGRLGTS